MRWSWIFTIVLLYFVLLTKLNCFSSFTDYYSNSTRYTISNISYGYFGDPLNINCTLSEKFIEKGLDASHICFKWTDPSKPAGNICVYDGSETHIASNITSQLVITNVTKTGKAVFYCYVEQCNETCLVGKSKDFLVGTSKDIRMQYKPHKVTNVTCTLLNLDEYVECYWHHPVPYNRELNNVIISCTVVIVDIINKSSSCSHLTFNGCRWGNVERNKTHILQINVTNRWPGDSATTVFEFIPLNEVKPLAPQNVKVNVLDKTDCYNITWTQNKVDRFSKFHIFYQSPGDNNWKAVATNVSQTFWKICKDLQPFTTYNLSVKSQSKYLSDGSIVTYTTPEKAPLTGPEAVNGSYITEECNEQDGQRNVTLYWKDLNKKHQNGEIKQYIVKYQDVTKSVPRGNYKITLRVSCSSPATVRLFAVNNAGPSENPTILSIAPYQFQVPLVTKLSLSVELTNSTSVQIVWQSTHNNELLNFVVFWENTAENYRYQGPISWIHVPKHQYYINIAINNSLQYNFGLAVSDESNQWTSPIAWTDCFYEPIPSTFPTLKEINVIPYDESAWITWEKIKCSKQNRIKIRGYILRYCSQNRCNISNEITTVTISPDESSYTITKLDPVTLYMFALEVESHGINNSISEWKMFSTKSKSNSLTLTLIIIGITIVVLSLILIPIIICRLCLKSKEKISELSKDEACMQPIKERNKGVQESSIKVEESSGDNEDHLNIESKLLEVAVTNDDQSEHCENLPSDSRSLLLNPLEHKSEKSYPIYNGNLGISMMDIKKTETQPNAQDYLTIAFV
ncbi:cytokine receptor domeless [Biomphalaria pfeifferi]|uniref:Cytokine receptor domeless n=1 Tax=Biomphalaria pfeifferi TaxID=112525 RepID=A0AAD8FLI3_BIOPF|nr:cytokine receptor domeless [Biomphalaria pfeifferi]